MRLSAFHVAAVDAHQGQTEEGEHDSELALAGAVPGNFGVLWNAVLPILCLRQCPLQRDEGASPLVPSFICVALR